MKSNEEDNDEEMRGSVNLSQDKPLCDVNEKGTSEEKNRVERESSQVDLATVGPTKVRWLNFTY